MSKKSQKNRETTEDNIKDMIKQEYVGWILNNFSNRELRKAGDLSERVHWGDSQTFKMHEFKYAQADPDDVVPHLHLCTFNDEWLILNYLSKNGQG